MAKDKPEKLPPLGETTGDQKKHRLTMIGGAGGSGIPDRLMQKPSTGSFDTYRKMRRNPTIAMARLIATAPIRTAEWSVDADEGAPEAQPKFIKRQLDRLWHNLINNMMLGLDYGFSPFEIIWKAAEGEEGAKYVIDRCKPLLVDLTKARVDPDTGALQGLENQDVVLPLNQVLWYTYDQEAGDLYGRSRHENIRETAWRDWCDVAGRCSRYIKRVSGAVPMIEYPDGESTDKSGATRSHWDIARQLLGELEKCNGITMPNVLAPYVEDFARTGGNAKDLKAWHIGFLESKDSHGEEFLSLMRHKESLMLRGWLVPERAASEAQTAGSRADSESHADLMDAMSDLVLQDAMAAINAQIVDRLCQYNFGAESVGTIRLKRASIDSEVQAFFRELAKAVLGAPANIELLLETIDVHQLMDQAGLPQLKSAATLDQKSLIEKLKPPVPPAGPDGGPPKPGKKKPDEELAASLVDSVMDTYRRAHKELSSRAKEEKFSEKDADPDELEVGIGIEMEHTDDREVAKRIALDHLAEHPHYYTEILLPAEEKAEKNRDTKGRFVDPSNGLPVGDSHVMVDGKMFPKKPKRE